MYSTGFSTQWIPALCLLLRISVSAVARACHHFPLRLCSYSGITLRSHTVKVMYEARELYSHSFLRGQWGHFHLLSWVRDELLRSGFAREQVRECNNRASLVSHLLSIASGWTQPCMGGLSLIPVEWEVMWNSTHKLKHPKSHVWFQFPALNSTLQDRLTKGCKYSTRLLNNVFATVVSRLVQAQATPKEK